MCIGRHKSSEIQCHVVGWMIPNVLKGHGAFTFRVKNFSRTVKHWGWRYSNPSKRQEQLAWGHIVISQKTWVYSATTMRTSNLLMCISNLTHTNTNTIHSFIIISYDMFQLLVWPTWGRGYKYTKEKCAIREVSLIAHFYCVCLYPIADDGQMNDWNI